MEPFVARVTQFFQGQLSAQSRILMLVATLAIVPCIFLPTWSMTLHAPQYPEGLTLTIYPNTVGGDLREVNLLNHYIGMHEIAPNEFPEFRFISFFILRFFGFALLTALIGSMSLAVIGWMDFTLFGTVMLYTMQHWLHQYGHNLSPEAPLRIDAFSPSFIGTTHVGQFTVASWPAIGAILMGLAGVMGPVIAYLEWRRAGRATAAS